MDINIKYSSIEGIFILIGELLKSTPSTGNLSPDIEKNLLDKGLPIKNLKNFREFLVHYPLFSIFNKKY